MYDDFVLAELKILALHGYLRLVYLESVLLLHLDPEDALLETGHRNYSWLKILRLPWFNRILPCDHYVGRNAKPDK